jgi:hypothetical protein
MLHTRALGDGHSENLLGIIAGASLLGAVADTELVVVGLAKAGHIARLAAELGGLVVHVGDTHGLLRIEQLVIDLALT